jgi:hypothetical protein
MHSDAEPNHDLRRLDIYLYIESRSLVGMMYPINPRYWSSLIRLDGLMLADDDVDEEVEERAASIFKTADD